MSNSKLPPDYRILPVGATLQKNDVMVYDDQVTFVPQAFWGDPINKNGANIFFRQMSQAVKPEKTFIEECKELLNTIPVQTGDAARLGHRLSQAIDRLEAMVSQANAQFKVGDRYATFNKHFIENINKP